VWGRPLAGVGRQAQELGVTFRLSDFNGQPGAMFLDPSGDPINVMTLDIADGCVQTVRSVINPEKLGHLGPLADVRALVHERGQGRD
jgi:RNA polymerase sigma-70 factor, ECF subfamily